MSISATRRVARVSCLLGLVVMLASCVFAPREGYYDRAHHRYYHDHAWHACVAHDAHCR